MQIGDKAHIEKIFTAKDLQTYQNLGGHKVTNNQIPEPLLAGLISNLLGMKLPGLGTNYLKQQTDYIGTARIEETIITRVEITRLRPEKHLVDLETICTSETGDTICAGRALVYVKDVKW